ncbi:lycopene cyclase domain-containing protein [Subtercola endophyticus]|uniref:lycopene cyclase domain-containing protein n=1 Tax=Subtercola endophyticus TaxID=2895559 RepID=UPI001E5F15C8|nr:lycopene cyclase domain-containing protein [Subtercola endophyticus]UFS58231.1 lycopene cyclase domain-containing protein [Subtercola endophyticus]
MTYWGLNAFFLAAAVLLAVVARIVRRRPRILPLVVTAIILLVITAVFDNVMISIGLVGYNRALISGVFIGVAPLEDFAYALGAVLLLPALWALLPARDGSRRERK